MSEIYELKADVYFGKMESALTNWRSEKIENDEDPDDEELDVTPPEVVGVLGFDPAEE